MSIEQHDIIIIGGGLAGLTQAAALAAHGISCAIIDRADPAALLKPGFDGRTFAVSSSSVAMYEAIGLGDALAGKGCPITKIHVSDGLKRGNLDFVPASDDGFLGQMFESRVLREAIYTHITKQELITLHMPAQITAKHRGPDGVSVTLDNGTELRARLLVVAEGRQSATRDGAGIRFAHWQYDHNALVGAITHERPHGHIAYEIFYAAGPFAVLRMLDNSQGRHRSAIVWSVPRADAPAYLKLSKRAFAAEMEKAMGGMLGKVEMATDLMSYPLGFHHCAKITAERIVLVGDTAHGIHPIAGQGLNLGLRDVAALTEVLVDGARLGLDYGDAQLLDRYSRWRSVDTLMVVTASDTVNRVFAIPGKTASAVRRFGMGLIQRSGPVKSLLMAEARGEAGALPKLLEGVAV